MSFMISNRQSLATSDEIVSYIPYAPEAGGCEMRHVNIYFGHPLYNRATDILFYRNLSEKCAVIPVVPDGCISILFRWKEESKDASNIRGYLSGVHTEIQKLEAEPGESIAIIKFCPGAGSEIAGGSAAELVNVTIPLQEVADWSHHAVSVFRNDNDIAERIGALCRVIRVSAGIEPRKYIISYCTDRIIANGGNVKVEELSERLGFTTRHIGKEFEKHVGVSPKLFAQIVKLHATIAAMQQNPSALLVDIAVDNGFFDHAHMNRMYRKLMHCSSGEFRKHGFEKLDYTGVGDYITAV